MCNSIARLAESRFVLGVGIGYLIGEFEALGLEYEDRAKATEEFIGIFRQPPDHLSIVDAHVPPPMWVGGNSSSALKRAALLGDGWHPLWLPPNHYSEARRRITAWRDAARIDSPFTFSFSARFTDFADPPVGGWPPPAPRPPVGSEFRYAPPAWVMSDGRPGLVGTPDHLISDLRDLAEAGVEHITLRFGQVTTASLERFAQEVMPAF
jgi:alkanesulfonate monooxygenase SsuD/methylene tetrahydromethanopterin reductase-like flavin-dependent oxidoreductase (luciferase family)